MICNNAKPFANMQMIFKPSKTRMISVSIIIYCFYTKVICRNANNFCFLYEFLKNRMQYLTCLQTLTNVIVFWHNYCNKYS